MGEEMRLIALKLCKVKTKLWSLNSSTGSKTLNHYECGSSSAFYGNLQRYLLKEGGKFMRERQRENSITRQSVRDTVFCHSGHEVCSLEELNMGNLTHLPFIRLSISHSGVL